MIIISNISSNLCHLFFDTRRKNIWCLCDFYGSNLYIFVQGWCQKDICWTIKNVVGLKMLLMTFRRWVVGVKRVVLQMLWVILTVCGWRRKILWSDKQCLWLSWRRVIIRTIIKVKDFVVCVEKIVVDLEILWVILKVVLNDYMNLWLDLVSWDRK